MRSVKEIRNHNSFQQKTILLLLHPKWMLSFNTQMSFGPRLHQQSIFALYGQMKHLYKSAFSYGTAPAMVARRFLSFFFFLFLTKPQYLKTGMGRLVNNIIPFQPLLRIDHKTSAELKIIGQSAGGGGGRAAAHLSFSSKIHSAQKGTIGNARIFVFSLK